MCGMARYRHSTQRESARISAKYDVLPLWFGVGFTEEKPVGYCCVLLSFFKINYTAGVVRFVAISGQELNEDERTINK